MLSFFFYEAGLTKLNQDWNDELEPLLKHPSQKDAPCLRLQHADKTKEKHEEGTASLHKRLKLPY